MHQEITSKAAELFELIYDYPADPDVEVPRGWRQENGLLRYLMDHQVVSKSTCLDAGIKDPNRVVNHLREMGIDINTVTHRTTKFLSGGTWYQLMPSS